MDKKLSMIFREAQISDIKQIQLVRNAVRENVLSDPALVSDYDCEEFLTRRGKGWVCKIENRLVGFAIADLKENNIWALFVHFEFEGKGIGGKLHEMMLSWYFTQNKKNVWLGTEPRTKAERFYKKHGWRETGLHGKNEIKFEMTFDEYKAIHSR